MKGMKKGTRNRRKDRGPAQQPEQRIDETVFDVVDRGLLVRLVH
jgi:hypothetical protein